MGSVLLLAIISLLMTGCERTLTSKLWHTRDFAQSAYPAAPAKLEVFQEAAHGRLLVRYQEYSEKNNALTPRAYWLVENHELVEAGKRPKFVEFGQLEGLRLLTACTNAAECTNRATAAVSAYAPLKNGQSFVLCQPGREEGPYSLPAYDERTGTTTKVVLTPLAVVGDTVIVGSVVGIFFVYLYANGEGH
jgi:hypothetical protein